MIYQLSTLTDTFKFTHGKKLLNLSVIGAMLSSSCALASSSLSFDFHQGAVENGFAYWQYSDKGANPCGVYNGENQSKLCSTDGYKFYQYYNFYNTDHMGWTRYGYIDADPNFAISGSSLKVILTGGAYPGPNAQIDFLGKPIFSKSDYVSVDDLATDPSRILNVGNTTLYMKGPEDTSKFSMLQGNNRLSMWVLWPKEKEGLAYYSTAQGKTRPDMTFSWYPFIDTGKGGHYYHHVSNIPMGGWTKVQFDAHPQHHNAGVKNPYSAFKVGGDKYSGDGVAYFNNIATMAFVASFTDQVGYPAQVNIDEIQAHYQPYENDETINNLAIGYDQQTRVFDIGLSDKYRCLDCNARYEVKYAFSPITLDNYHNAHIPAEVINFNRQHSNGSGHIVKPNPGYNNVWAALELKPEHKQLLTANTKIYFAVKDISDRSNINQEDIDFAMNDVPNVGQVKTIDLIKTIDYTIHLVDYPLELKTQSLDEGVAGHTYFANIAFSGGSAPYTLAATTALPNGIHLDANGFISGTPTQPGTYEFGVKVSDSSGKTAEGSIVWTVKTEEDYHVARCTGLVDFNASTTMQDAIQSNAFDTVIADVYTGNIEFGKTNVIGSNGDYNYQGITGSNGLELQGGDQIRSVWYNNSDQTVIFTPKISFDDVDRPDSGSTGTWTNMESVQVKPRRWAVSNFYVPDGTATPVYTININVNYDNHKTLVLDKIEHVSVAHQSSSICIMPFANSDSPTTPIVLKESQLATARVDEFYTAQIQIEGGVAPYYVHALTDLPANLNLNSSGVLSGTPSQAGAFFIDVMIRDQKGQTITGQVALDVLARYAGNATHCKLVVDFAGASNNQDLVALTGFERSISDRYTHNTNIGRTIAVGNHKGYNYQGVTGSGVNMKVGDKIRTIWYNNSNAAITFTPRVSFDDPDRVVSGLQGAWRAMSTITIEPKAWQVSEFVITTELSGIQGLLNTNVNYTNRKQLVLDKIEYVSLDFAVDDLCALPSQP